nr:dnapol B-like protein [Apis mellifera nudivirus]
MAGFHNNDYFVLKNQLETETRQKLQTQVRTLGENEEDVRRIYVIEWISDADTIYALGCDIYGRTVKLPMNISPGVFAISSNVPLLQTVCELHNCHLEIYEQFKYRCNNFAPWDILMDYEYTERPVTLVKICTETVSQANEIFYKFRREECAYRYVSVPLYWSPTKQILFERLTKYCRDNNCVTYNVPKITMRWFDADLNCYEYPEPQIPVITFDIETVSTDPNRVPYGDHVDDELFTVSIHHTHTNVLYTLAYLPLEGKTVEEMKQLIYDDNYPTYPDLRENIVECFKSERDLLLRTMELLTLPNQQLHILVGYNSMSYDIKYLFLRCAFYNLDLPDEFVYREGYAYGFSQIHLDLFRIIMSQYKLKNYKLNNVSNFLLKDTKTGVDAVKLRYTFHAIRYYNRYFKHDDCIKWPSIRDILHYNNYDTILVSKLLKRANSIEFTINQAHECRIELSSLNSNYNKMRFKLWSKCFVVGLEIGIFQTTFKSSTAIFRLPLENNDYTELRISLNEQLQGNNSKETATPFKYQLNDILHEKKIKYPGGANFCLGEYVVDNVQMLDYRIAYPLLIDRQNISDETATILPANIIHLYLLRMPNERWRMFRTFDYMAHTGNSKSETSILYHQYIYEGLYCGGEFPCTLEELNKRGSSPVVIIWQGRRGIFSDIITRFNNIREDTKNMRKLLDGVIALIDDRISETHDIMEAIGGDERNTSNDVYDNSNANVEDNDGDFGVNDDGDFGINDDGDFGINDDGDFGLNEDNNNGIIRKEMKEDNDGDFGIINGDKDDKEVADDEEDDGDFGLNNEEEDEEDEGDFGLDDKNDRKDDNDDNDNGDFGLNNTEDNDDGDFGLNNNAEDDSNGDFGLDNAKDDNAGTEMDGDFGRADDGDFGLADDGDFNINETGSNEMKEVVNCMTNKNNVEITTTAQNTNAFNLKFVNEYIAIYANRTVALNDELLSSLSYKEQLAVLEDLRRDASTERDKFQNSYELQKSLVASIYGCIGTSSPVCAALITNGIRSTILQAAQYVVSKGYTVYYIDTDSLFIKHPTETRDLSPELNHRFPHTEIEMKIYKQCLFVQKKTYYTVTPDGTLKYFQHVNGSPAWRDFVQYIYQHSNIYTNEDVYKLFVNFFQSIYDRLLSFDKITPELEQMISQEVKIKAVYKTNTHLAKLKLYLQTYYPALAGSYRQIVYYIMETDVKQTTFRPIAHLKDISDLVYVNMFKFYQNVFKTVFNIIKFHIRRNNEPFIITISPRQVLLSMINAYLDVHEKCFPQAHIDAEMVNASRDIDDYDYLHRIQNEEEDEEYVEATATSSKRKLGSVSSLPNKKLI